MKWKIRYHLAKGKNYMKWQIKDSNGDATYLDPDTTYIRLTKCKLKNHANIAQKIYEGSNKTVCSWIEFGTLKCSPSSIMFNHKDYVRVYYNPRHIPFWTTYVNTGASTSENLDNTEYDEIIIKNKEIYVKKISASNS